MNKENRKNAYMMTNLMTDESTLFTGEEITLINDILAEYNEYLYDQMDEADTHEEEEAIMKKRVEIDVIRTKLTDIMQG